MQPRGERQLKRHDDNQQRHFDRAARERSGDPYTGNLEVRPEGKSNALLTIQNVRFDPNKAYTLVITGAVNNGKPEMEAVIVEDKIGN